MSAAATAAGYLYASGRLRGRKDDAERKDGAPEPNEARPRRPLKVAAMPPQVDDRDRLEDPAGAGSRQAERPSRPAPKIQYRTRRWKPDAK